MVRDKICWRCRAVILPGVMWEPLLPGPDAAGCNTLVICEDCLLWEEPVEGCIDAPLIDNLEQMLGACLRD